MSLPVTTPFGEPLLKADELAAALGFTRRQIYELVEQRGLPCYRIGRSLIFEVSAVKEWLRGFRAGSWPEVTP